MICQGGRRTSLSRWDEGSDSDHVTCMNWDSRLVGHCKILAWQWAKLPRYGREGAVEVRPFPAERRSRASEAQGLSDEAMKGNPPTMVIPGVDESKPSAKTDRTLGRTSKRYITGRMFSSARRSLCQFRWMRRTFLSLRRS